MQRSSAASRVSLCAMTVSMSFLFLYASEAIPAMRLFFCFLSALPSIVLITEGYNSSTWLCYIAVSLLGFFLCAERISWFFYISLLGHFGILRSFFCKNISIPAIRVIVTVLYCNGGIALAAWALKTIAGVSILKLFTSLPVLVYVLLGEICLFILDVLYEFSLQLYLKKFRRLLLS